MSNTQPLRKWKGVVDPQPKNESGRAKALHSYDILDTEKEEAFDSITRLASYICGTKIALISFIDHNRQWIKSSEGIDVTETTRDVSFCQYTVLGNQVLEIFDATKDEVLNNNPFVTGEPFIRFYAGVPLTDPDGYNLGTLCVLDNEPKKLSADQKDALRTLASEVVSQLVLRTLLKKERELTQIKAKFVATAGHQFKTPLAIIKSNSELIELQLNGLGEPNLDSVIRATDRIKHQVNRLNALVHDSLMLSKPSIATGGLNKTGVDIIPWIKRLVEGFNQEHAPTRSIELIIKDADLQVDINVEQLEHVIVNLLTNAIKYSPVNDVPKLQVYRIAKTGEVVLEVSDKGIGIPSTDLPRLFEPFYRADNVGDVEGTGLGLSIVQEYTALNGGTTTVESKEGKGSSFKVILPKKS